MQNLQEIPPSPECWQHVPLCCRYLVVHFDTAFVRVAWSKALGLSPVHWAMGMTPEGEREVLGVWASGLNGTWEWNQAIDEMVIRGVERIRFATGERQIAHDLDRLGATYLLMGGDGEKSLAQLASTLPRYLRGTVKTAVRESQVAKTHLIHLSRRRRRFESQEAAIGAVKKSLQQLGRQRWASSSITRAPHLREASAIRG